MNYSQRGYNTNLKKIEDKNLEPFTKQEVDFVIPEINGDKIRDYKSERFEFRPSVAPLAPREGHIYYDKELKKLKVWTGSEWEVINSV
jgi:hypothetical protein